MPVLLFVTQITTSTLSQIAWGKFVNLQFDLLENLATLSDQWVVSNGTSVDSVLRGLVSAEGSQFLATMARSETAFVRSAWTNALW
jgi:hypothetical protein